MHIKPGTGAGVLRYLTSVPESGDKNYNPDTGAGGQGLKFVALDEEATVPWYSCKISKICIKIDCFRVFIRSLWIYLMFGMKMKHHAPLAGSAYGQGDGIHVVFNE